MKNKRNNYIRTSFENVNKMQLLQLTDTERRRAAEDQRIAAEFKALRRAYPEASAFRIIRTLAGSGRYQSKSIAGIRNALVRTETIQPAKRS